MDLEWILIKYEIIILKSFRTGKLIFIEMIYKSKIKIAFKKFEILK